jgi:hypothetical protein
MSREPTFTISVEYTDIELPNVPNATYNCTATVTGTWIDDSFDHAFGTEERHHMEVTTVCIDSYEKCNEDMSIDKVKSPKEDDNICLCLVDAIYNKYELELAEELEEAMNDEQENIY